MPSHLTPSPVGRQSTAAGDRRAMGIRWDRSTQPRHRPNALPPVTCCRRCGSAERPAEENSGRRTMVERWTGVWGKCRRCLALVFAQPDVGHDRRRHGHRARGGDSTGRSPTTPRRTGTARHRHPLGDRLPRGHTALQRRLRGHRGLLRDLGVRDHRLVAAGARDNGTHVSAQLLWAPGAPHPSDGDARHHRHHHCFVRVHRRLRRRPDRDRRQVGRPLPCQLPLRGDRYELPRSPVAAVAVVELLVPRCRGAVLHRLPGALLVLGVVGAAGAAGVVPAPNHRRPRRRHRCFLHVLHRVHRVECAERVLLAAGPFLGAGARGTDRRVQPRTPAHPPGLGGRRIVGWTRSDIWWPVSPSPRPATTQERWSPSRLSLRVS